MALRKIAASKVGERAQHAMICTRLLERVFAVAGHAFGQPSISPTAGMMQHHTSSTCPLPTHRLPLPKRNERNGQT
jgi:hypothetical protein